MRLVREQTDDYVRPKPNLPGQRNVLDEKMAAGLPAALGDAPVVLGSTDAA
ncbi:MAG: hypothetical protein ABW224_13410 [Kibdelosporangium sp.]